MSVSGGGGGVPISTVSRRDCISFPIHDCKFPDQLREADLGPIFKNDDSLSKEDVRPMSILPLKS